MVQPGIEEVSSKNDKQQGKAGNQRHPAGIGSKHERVSLNMAAPRSAASELQIAKRAPGARHASDIFLPRENARWKNAVPRPECFLTKKRDKLQQDENA